MPGAQRTTQVCRLCKQRQDVQPKKTQCDQWPHHPTVQVCFVRWMHILLLFSGLSQLQQKILHWFYCCKGIELDQHCMSLRSITSHLFSSQILARVEGPPAGQRRWRVRKPLCPSSPYSHVPGPLVPRSPRELPPGHLQQKQCMELCVFRIRRNS